MSTPGTRFEGRTAIVTGAGRGIGRATAQRLASEGATVVVNDVDEDTIAQSVESLAGLAGRGVAGRADITDESQVVELVRRTVADHGGVDILVNNAGGAMPGTSWAPVEHQTLADWRAFVALNLDAAFVCTREVLPSMLERGWGRVVCVSSISATNGQRNGAAYAAAKAGLHALVASVAKENAERGVRANGIIVGNAPHPTRTPERQALLDEWVHLARVGAYDEFAAAIAFLCSDDASYLSGAMIPVDGGFSRFNQL
jgi:NAD(P)-dependent dehydrogenase (short-subunit alcohol dehydrogenase family)